MWGQGAERRNVKLNEQTSDEEGGKRQPRPCRDGFGVAAAQEHSSDGRLSPNKRLPVVEGGRRKGKAQQDDERGEEGDGSGTRAGKNEKECNPGYQSDDCEWGRRGWGDGSDGYASECW